MTHEEAEAWCRTHGFAFYSYTTRATGYENGPPKEGGEIRWDVSGWAWRKGARDKVRLHEVGVTLERCVEKIRARRTLIINH